MFITFHAYIGHVPGPLSIACAILNRILERNNEQHGMERIKAAISLQKADRVPVIPQVFGHAASMTGVDLGDYLRDGELLAGCQLKALERYGYDAVFALMDVYVETEAAGSVLSYRDALIDLFAPRGGFILSSGCEIPLEAQGKI